MTVGTPREDCDHRERYTAQGGHDLCERCAREAAGWKPCVVCGELLPPDERRCERHLPEGEKNCPDCMGEGWVDCEEPDCHGSKCHGEGRVDCPTCGATGTVKKEKGTAA